MRDRIENEIKDPYVCYAAKANSYVIRADGRIGKCTVVLKSNNNYIGRILQDGTLEIDAKEAAPWLTGWKTQQRKALACPAAVVFVNHRGLDVHAAHPAWRVSRPPSRGRH